MTFKWTTALGEAEWFEMFTWSQAVPAAVHHLLTDHTDSQAESWGHVEAAWLGQYLHARQGVEVSIQQRPDCRLNLHVQRYGKKKGRC